MFLPFETTLSLWFNTSPMFGWEPVPVVPPNPAEADAQAQPLATTDSGDAADGVQGAACRPSPLPVMRLVFKGVNWSAYPVFGMRENPVWDQMSQTRRDVDEEHRADALRDARKPGAKPPPPKT